MLYRYAHFDRRALDRGRRFRGGPKVQSPLPCFDLPTTDGRRVDNDTYVGRPLFLMVGSITCPMTATALHVVTPLYEKLRNRVQFLTVYVREAYPGERHPQPTHFAQKLAHARELHELHRIPWTVAVDDIDGTFHRAIDEQPTSAYFIDEDGIVVYRSLAGNDRGALECGFEVLLHRRVPRPEQSERVVVPMLRSIGAMDETVGLGGKSARRDLRRASPGLYLLSKLARAFSPLPPFGRGLAAVLTVGALSLAGIGALLFGTMKAVGERSSRHRRRRRLLVW